jgi:hypothetical protein
LRTVQASTEVGLCSKCSVGISFPPILPELVQHHLFFWFFFFWNIVGEFALP